MAIIGKINNKVLLDDCVLREEPEVLTRWIDPAIQEKDKEIERLTNIINELENYLIEMSDRSWDDNGAYDDVLDKLKELKEQTKC